MIPPAPPSGSSTTRADREWHGHTPGYPRVYPYPYPAKTRTRVGGTGFRTGMPALTHTRTPHGCTRPLGVFNGGEEARLHNARIVARALCSRWAGISGSVQERLHAIVQSEGRRHDAHDCASCHRRTGWVRARGAIPKRVQLHTSWYRSSVPT